MNKDQQKVHDAIADSLIAQGKLIAGGFEIFRSVVLATHATDAQVEDLRIAWFAGAQHVFSSIMATLDEGEDATEADLQRMKNIADELDSFKHDLALRMTPTKTRRQ